MSLLLRALLGACLVMLCAFVKGQESPITFQLEKTRISLDDVKIFLFG